MIVGKRGCVFSLSWVGDGVVFGMREKKLAWDMEELRECLRLLPVTVHESLDAEAASSEKLVAEWTETAGESGRSSPKTVECFLRLEFIICVSSSSSKKSCSSREEDCELWEEAGDAWL